MAEDTTKHENLTTPIARARQEITAARQLAGGEDRPLTSEDRKKIVIGLTKALRAVDEIERTYVPREVES